MRMPYVRYTTLFGKSYIWVREGGQLRLYPDFAGRTLFPRTNQRVLDAYMKGNK